MTSEEWKPIIGYEGLYEISTFGRVKSLERFEHYLGRLIKGKILKNFLSGEYLAVKLSKNGKARTSTIHLLVWDAFGDKRRSRGYHVDHINNDKHYNYITNLQLLRARLNTSKGFNRDLPTGVYKTANKYKKYRVCCKLVNNGKQVFIGSFKTIPEAKAAYENKLKELGLI